MTNKKTFNPFRMWGSYAWGFLIVFFYITLVITSNVFYGVIEDFNIICEQNCNELSSPNRELCIDQCTQTINQSTDTLLQRFNFLENFKQTPIPAVFPFIIINPKIIMWIMILFIVGFLSGWGVGSLKRVIER